MSVRRIHQLPAADRPREKLQRKGSTALSDFELLEVIIGSGTKGSDVGSIARAIQKQLRRGVDEISYESLTSIRGVSMATASKVLAAIELARRHLVRDVEPVRSTADILTRLHDIRDKQQEYLICLSLDGAQRVLAQRTITVGTLDSVMAHPREVYADPIADRAASIILAHNHPSGEPTPSQRDIELTQQLQSAGQLLGIPLRDHVIVTRAGYFSFRLHQML